MAKRIIRFFTRDDWRAMAAQVTAQLIDKTDDWGIRGWSLVGSSDELRVSVCVDERLASPTTPVGCLKVRLNDRWISLKPAVHASHESILARGRKLTGGVDLHDAADDLRPGRAIEIARDADGARERAGITCFVVIDDEMHLVTCGHAFKGSRKKVFEAGEDREIGELRDNFLRSDDTLDVGVVRLTRHGLARLRLSTPGPPWTTRIRVPGPQQHGEDALFVPTAPGDSRPRVTKIFSSNAYEPRLFPGNAARGLLAVELCSTLGDSGAPLYHRRALYGLCGGRGDTFSYFTPIHSVWKRLRSHYEGDVFLWQPE